MHSFIESDVSDTDNIVPFEIPFRLSKITRSKQKKAEKINQVNRSGICGISNGTVLSVSDTSESINECTQEINSKVKLHILGVWPPSYAYH